MQIYLDETGNTGRDILNAEQPVFVLASTNLNDVEARELRDKIFAGVKAAELKHSALSSRTKGQVQIVQLIEELLRLPERAAVAIAHKEYVLLGLLVDFWIEPVLYRGGHSFYEGGANIGFTNVAYYTLRACLDDNQRRAWFAAAQEMLWKRTRKAYLSFGRRLRAAIDHHELLRKALEFFVMADTILGGYQHLLSVPDRLSDIGTYGLLESAAVWCARTQEALILIPDKSAALAREKDTWDVVLSQSLPPTIVGSDRRTIRFPLNVSQVRPEESHKHLQLQFADIIAGAYAIHYRNEYLGESYRPDYAARLATLDMHQLVINAVWPSTAVTPEELDATGANWGDTADYLAAQLRLRRTRIVE